MNNDANAIKPELVCPAGSLPSLRSAVDNGADCVYLGLRDATNARNFAGLNFDEAAIAEGIRYAHDRGRKVFMALNTYPQAADSGPWQRAVDAAHGLGADAVILADPGLMQYAAERYPQLRLHLSVQGPPPTTRRSTCTATASGSRAPSCPACSRSRRSSS